MVTKRDARMFVGKDILAERVGDGFHGLGNQNHFQTREELLQPLSEDPSQPVIERTWTTNIRSLVLRKRTLLSESYKTAHLLMNHVLDFIQITLVECIKRQMKHFILNVFKVWFKTEVSLWCLLHIFLIINSPCSLQGYQTWTSIFILILWMMVCFLSIHIYMMSLMIISLFFKMKTAKIIRVKECVTCLMSTYIHYYIFMVCKMTWHGKNMGYIGTVGKTAKSASPQFYKFAWSNRKQKTYTECYITAKRCAIFSNRNQAVLSPEAKLYAIKWWFSLGVTNFLFDDCIYIITCTKGSKYSREEVVLN